MRVLDPIYRDTKTAESGLERRLVIKIVLTGLCGDVAIQFDELALLPTAC